MVSSESYVLIKLSKQKTVANTRQSMRYEVNSGLLYSILLVLHIIDGFVVVGRVLSSQFFERRLQHLLHEIVDATMLLVICEEILDREPKSFLEEGEESLKQKRRLSTPTRFDIANSKKVT